MSPLQDVDSFVSGPLLQDTPLCLEQEREAESSHISGKSLGAPAVRLQSHNLKAGRRRSGLRRGVVGSWTWILTMLVLATLCGRSEAKGGRSRYEAELELAELAHGGGILIDTRPVPRVGKRDLRFFPRQDGSLFGSTTATPLSTSGVAPASTAGPSASSIPSSTADLPSASSASLSSTPTASSSLMTASTVPTNVPLPKPFDSSLGSNFTSSSCPAFFDSFLKNATFTSCLPFSLLLQVRCSSSPPFPPRPTIHNPSLTPIPPSQNSNSFFQAEKSPALLTHTLDASCAADLTSCSTLMSSLAVQLRDDANCGLDYADENALAVQAYDGLVSYAPLYRAGCLKDARGAYCFANAVTNRSSPSDPYPYFLPLGFALPGGSSPTCSACLQQTMDIFAAAAANLSQPVSADYNNAAVQIDQVCGPAFVNSTVKPVQGTQASGGVRVRVQRGLVTALLLGVVLGTGLLGIWS
ncbi:hypothetical protein MMC26_003040 [Xylographa opegraphella]|nr:hypothetical protein [Xylographa opegraphella]